MELFAPAEPQLQLHPGALEIKAQGDQAVAVALHIAEELQDLPPVHQQLALAHGVPVEDIALLIGGDVHPVDEKLAAVNRAIAVLQIDGPGPQAFDLGARQGDAAFIGLLHEIVVPRLAVDGDLLDLFLFQRAALLSLWLMLIIRQNAPQVKLHLHYSLRQDLQKPAAGASCRRFLLAPPSEGGED